MSPSISTPKEKTPRPGIKVDLIPPQPGAGARETFPPLLVDFTGGRRKVGIGAVEEETAVDALILMPDGKLRVLNSRDASDTSNDAREAEAARERQGGLQRSHQRVAEEMQNAAPVGPNLKGPMGVPNSKD